MEDTKIREYAEKLAGISYNEWVKLSSSINFMFDCKKRELERQLKLSDTNDVVKAFHSRFG